MIKDIVMDMLKFLSPPERKEYSREFVSTLCEQARVLHRPIGFIAMVAWVNFAFRIDPVLHPEFPELFFFRMALTLSGAYVFVVSFFEPLRGKGLGLVYLLLTFSLLSCSFFTGRIAADAGYVSGLQILILLIIVAPMPFSRILLFYFFSVVLFGFAVFVYRPDLSSMASQYSLNNLLITYVLGLIMGYILDRLRFNMFLNQVRLNQVLTDMRYLIKDVSHKAGIVTSASRSLGLLSDKMAGSSRKMVDKMGEITDVVFSAVSRTNSNMEGIAGFMEKSSGNIALAESATEDITSTIHQMAENSRQVRSSINDTMPLVVRASSSVEQLGQAAETISSVSSAIAAISGQTNLLSLNATIEAARAGEAGRGFAVVASEVKQLAGQAGQATKDIKQQIELIQSATTATVEFIRQISKDMNHINDIASANSANIEEQLGAVNQITDNVNQASSGIQEANHNLANTTTVSTDVTETLTGLKESSGDIADLSSQVKESVKELSDMADQLNKMLDDLEGWGQGT